MRRKSGQKWPKVASFKSHLAYFSGKNLATLLDVNREMSIQSDLVVLKRA
jgi:hypothetical protein